MKKTDEKTISTREVPIAKWNDIRRNKNRVSH